MKQMQTVNPLDPLTFFANQQTYDWKRFGHEVNAQFPRPVAESDPKFLTLVPSTENPYPSISTRTLETSADTNPFLDMSHPQLIQKNIEASTVVTPGMSSTLAPILQPPTSKKDTISPRPATRSTTGHSKPRDLSKIHYGFVDTFRMKTTTKKDKVKKRSNSDDPALKFE